MLAALVHTRANAAFVTQRRVTGVSEAMIKQHLCYDVITLLSCSYSTALDVQPTPSAARRGL